MPAAPAPVLRHVFRKRKRSDNRGAGPGPQLRRFRGYNVPPGLFAHAQPVTMPRRYSRTYTDYGRVSGRKYRVRAYQRNRKRSRSKYPRVGSRSIAMRPALGKVVPTEIKRQYIESGNQVWPQTAGAGTPPTRSPVYCPFSFQYWLRGLSDSQFTGSKVTLKNISVMMQIVPPVNVPIANNKPYRLRIVQGWCKQNAVVPMASTGSSAILAAQYPNGMAVNQAPPVATTLLRGNALPANETAHVQTLFQSQSDFVGIYGNHQNEASYPSNMYMILKDVTRTLAPSTEQPAAAPATGIDRQFTPLVQKLNFTCNKQFRLSAMTTVPTDPPTGNAEWFSPINVPGQWIPFVNVFVLNAAADYTSTAHMPTVKITENAFFLDN